MSKKPNQFASVDGKPLSWREEPKMTASQLKAARLELGLSRADLGWMTGYSYRTIVAYEQGTRPVSKPIAKVVRGMIRRQNSGKA